jgi:hypothetical protein
MEDYPEIYLAAKFFLSCVASSTNVERFFSDFERLYTDLRANMDDHTITMWLYCHWNLMVFGSEIYHCFAVD